MADSYGFGGYVRNALDARLLAKRAVEKTKTTATQVVEQTQAYTLSIADHVKKLAESWRENGADLNAYVREFGDPEEIATAETNILQRVASTYLSLLGGNNN